MHRCARKEYADKLLRYRLQTRARAYVYVYAYVYVRVYIHAQQALVQIKTSNPEDVTSSSGWMF